MEDRYIVCVRDGAAGEDDYIGPFRDRVRAQALRDRINARLVVIHDDPDPEVFAAIEPITRTSDFRMRDFLEA